jgi:hypothetical protein
MAHIVPFRAAAARDAEEADASSPGSAQIVIFPGVRRERHTEPPASPASPASARNDSSRDWLELPDEPPVIIP